MMLFTTVFIAALVIAAVYFLLVRFIPWRIVSYCIMLVAGIAFLLLGSVHFIYVGIEVIAFGCLLVRIHYKHLIKKERAVR